MLVFIKNTPRAYAWGSTEALPAILKQPATGEPQAELWLGDHEGSPAEVAKARNSRLSLIDLIASDPEVYGVDGGPLPFLMKVLGIGAPLSIQVHPDADQARRGFEREEAAGVPRRARERSYRDPNHKPELLAALETTRALCGFRSVSEVRADVSAIAAAMGSCGAAGSQHWLAFAARLRGHDSAEALRGVVLGWLFSGDPVVQETVTALTRAALRGFIPGLSTLRYEVLRALAERYPADPGVLVSLLLRAIELQPGEALFLAPGQLHAYVSGVAVEVMASSDNVLRAGLTEKHIDTQEMLRVLDLGELGDPRVSSVGARPGLTTWEPPIPDFVLHRVRVAQSVDMFEGPPDGCADTVRLASSYPLVMIVTEGSMRVIRAPEAGQTAGSTEVASVRQGQSLYISSGEPVEFSGRGEAFLATVGSGWGAVAGGPGNNS